MVALLGENTLLLMRPSDRGQLVPQLLEEVENLPRDIKPGLLRVHVVSEPNANGQVRFALPSGQEFLAKPNQPLPNGSIALVQIRTDNAAPQVLRVILPPQNATNGQSVLQQTPSPSILLGVAKQGRPQIGESLTLQPLKPNTNSLNQTSFLTPNSRVRMPSLPAPGSQVLGQILNTPSGGTQTLLLANKIPLLIANPPVFAVNSNLILRMTGQNQAVLEKLTPPAEQAQTKQQQGQQQPQGQPLKPSEAIKPPSTQLPNQPEATTPQRVPNRVSSNIATSSQQVDLPQFKPVATLPLTLQKSQNFIHQVTLTGAEKNIYTLKTSSGLEFKVEPVMRRAPTAQGSAENASQRASADEKAFQALIKNTLSTGIKMSVRFTENGLIDVLRVAEPHNRLDPNLNHNKQNQSGQHPSEHSGRQNPQPTPLPTGHIATGSVTQQKPDGRLVLQFEKGISVEVQAQRMLPVGSKLSIQIMPDGHAEIIDISLPKGSERSNTLLRFAVAWEGINRASEELARSNPEAHQKFVNALPRANESLLPHLIQFSSAVANQNLQAIFGDDVINVLRALGLDGMLQSDLSQMHTLQQQRPDSSDNWRALLFPYWDDQEDKAKQGGFYWRRHHKDDAENANPDEGTLRFVVNLQMSELGHTQLDGLMQEHENLYLKLRTQHALSEDEQADLRKLVTESLNMLGLEGNIQLQNVNFFEVDPLHDILRSEGGNLDAPASNQINVEA